MPLSACYLDIWALVISCFNTYESILLLTTNKIKYPAQAKILTRVLIDTLFNISAILEAPFENSKRFAIGIYRWRLSRYRSDLANYRNMNIPKASLEYQKMVLAGLEKLMKEDYKVNKGDLENRIKFPDWQLPSRMIDKKNSKRLILDEERRTFLEIVYHNEYNISSEIMHQTSMGVEWTFLSAIPEKFISPVDKEKAGKMTSDALNSSILYLLMIASEVEASFKVIMGSNLNEIWRLFAANKNRYYKYYDIRYKDLLRKLEGPGLDI